MEMGGEMLSQMNLANELTIAARADTYEGGTDGVQKPADLRKYNEVMHREVKWEDVASP
jgi:hypothetical protein